VTVSGTDEDQYGVLPGSSRVGLVLLLAAGVGLVGSTIAFAFVDSDAPGQELTGAEEFAVALPLLLALGGGAAVAAGLDGARPLRVFGVRGFDLVSVVVGVLAGLVLQALVVVLDTWVVEPLLGDDPESSARDLVDAFSGAGETVLLVLLVVVLAPVAEELFYRGVLIPLVMRRWRPGWAVLVVGVVFALSHLQGTQLPGLLVVGVVLGTLRLWRRSVVAPVVAHMTFNAVGLALIWSDLTW
jgi:membrane protease YdiL (CAAX protease family)